MKLFPLIFFLLISVSADSGAAEPVAVAWFAEYETLGVFSRRIDGREIDVNEIDVYGNTETGKLKRIKQ